MRLKLKPEAEDTPAKMMDAEAQAVLQSLGHFMCVDIAAIEAAHSSNREVALLKSRGWYTSLETLSAIFMSKVVGSAATGVVLKETKGSKKARGEDSDKAKASSDQRKEKIVRGGGAYRAFLHEVAKGQRLTSSSMSAFAAQYRALSPAERQRYQMAGEAATLAHRHKVKAFPKNDPALQSSSSLVRFEHPADRPQPGDVTESGAIIAADSDGDLMLQTMYTGHEFFLEKYTKVQKLAHSDRRQRVGEVELTDEEAKALHCIESSAPEQVLPKAMQSDQHVEMSSSVRTLFAQKGMVGLEWFAPAEGATKAGPV